MVARLHVRRREVLYVDVVADAGAVGVLGELAMLFRDRDLLGLAVGGASGREHEPLDVRLNEGTQEADALGDVVLPVGGGFLDGLADKAKAAKL